MQKKNLYITFITFLVLFFQSNAYSWPIPHSGKTTCYDNEKEISCPKPGEPFYGQNGNYIINPKSYSKMDEQSNVLPDDAEEWFMVKDNVIGLIWEVKQANDGVEDYTNIHDADNKYGWYDSNPETNCGDEGNYNDGKNTESFLQQINESKFGGFDDWRVPSLKELRSIFEEYSSPAINQLYFRGIKPDVYLSSTTLPGSGMNVSVVSFEKGYSCRMQSKHGSDFVRAVRGGSCRPFVINDDKTVTDTNTGLMWSVDTSEITMNWEDALNYCETSSLAGYTDWRLPHFEELSSILDFTRSPSIDTKFFDIRNSSYWSSSSSSPSYAQTVHYSTTLYCGSKRKDSSIYVRAIRGGQLQLTDHLFITSPRQASFWQVDDIIPITWEIQNISGNVRISLSRNAGRDGTYETIAETDNDGAYDWKVTGDISVNCMLKIEPVDIPDRGSQQGLFTIHTYSPDQYQKVELSSVSTTLSEPSLFTLTANYSTSNNSKTNGIEVRFFYNSSLVSFVSFENVLLPATINTQSVTDTDNFDNDVFTDQYIVLAWKSSLSNWPSGSQPVKLADLKFIGLKQGQTSINVRLFDIFDGYDEKSNHADINILKSHPPSIPTIISSSHELGVCKDLETIELSWENHDESIIGYSILWDTNPLSIPEESISITETNTISPALNNANNHYFHISAVNDDVVCLWSKPLHYGPFCIGSNIKISDIPVQTTTINTASEPIEVSITKADYSMLTDVTISFKSDNTEIVPVDNITFNEINGKKYLIIMPTLNIWGSTNITLLAKDDSNYSEKSFLFKVHPFIIDTPENKANISSEEGLNFIRGTVLDASNIINVVEVEIYDTKYRKYLTPEYRWEEFGIFEVPVNNTWEINTMNVFWKSNTIYEITVRFFDETNCDYLVFNDTCLYECESLCEPDCTDEDFGKCGWKCIHEFFESNNCFFQYTSSFGYDIITPSIISCNLPKKQ